jgi:hypothetical protein
MTIAKIRERKLVAEYGALMGLREKKKTCLTGTLTAVNTTWNSLDSKLGLHEMPIIFSTMKSISNRRLTD